jgi:putative membrane protein
MKRSIFGTAMAAALGLAMTARADDGMRADKPMDTKPAMGAKAADGMKDDKDAAKTDKVGAAVLANQDKADQTRLIAKLHKGNLKEIEMGGLAQKNGGAAVRRYGEMLVNDHKKADVDTLNYTAKMGVSMAEPGKPAMGKDDPEMADHMKMDDLKAMKGQAFDKQFLTMMVADHKEDIAEVKAARAKLQAGDELAALLDSMLPTLQKHLDSAQTALTKMGPQARRPE